MKKFLKIVRAQKSDSGLSLAEILVSVGLTGLLALGCTQLALASFTSANYSEAVAVKSLNSGNANRLITTDIENASGFLVPSGNVDSKTLSACVSSSSVQPLVSIEYNDGSKIGYEVRSTQGITALWRVSCPNGVQATGPELMVRNSLPATSSPDWQSAIQCATFPSGGTLTSSASTSDSWLTSISINPGIIFTIPATSAHSSIPVAAQSIVAARNVG